MKKLLLSVFVFLSSCGGDVAPVEVVIENGRGQFELIWRQNGGGMSPFLRPAVDGDVVCTVSRGGLVSFFNLADGKTARRAFNLATPIGGGVGCREQLVAVAAADGSVMVHHSDGEMLWRRQSNARIFAVPRIENGRLYVLDLDGRLSAYSARRGELLWRYSAPIKNLLRTPLESSPLIGHRFIFAGLDNGALVAVNKDSGKLRWRRTTSRVESANPVHNITDMTTPATAGGLVCAAAYQSNIACVTVDGGRILWQSPFSAVRRVVFDRDGARLFAVGYDGVITAFGARNGEVLWRNESLKGGKVGALAFVQGAVIAGYGDGKLLAVGGGDGAPLAKTRLSAGDIIFLRAINDGEVLGLSLDGVVFRAAFVL